MAARGRLTEAEAGAVALPDLDAARTAVEQLKMAVMAARITMMSARGWRDEVRRERARRASGGGKRFKRNCRAGVCGWGGGKAQRRTGRAQGRGRGGAGRPATPEELAIQREDLAAAIEKAEARRGKAQQALIVAETALREAQIAERDAERLAGEARETRARADARAEAARAAQGAAAARIHEDTEQSPEQLLEALAVNPDTLPSVEALDTEVNRLRRSTRGLGRGEPAR